MTSDDAAEAAVDDGGLDALLDHVRRTRGFDFTGYKRPTIARRVGKRLQALGLDSYAAYTDHLQVDPAEYARLFDTLLINVTRFMRDREAWLVLRDEILPDLLATTAGQEQVRVWSAGCSSGQEAYTTAIMLAEAMGSEQFTRRVTIYGTDIDADALGQARQATYRADELEPLGVELRDRYFRPAPPGARGTDNEPVEWWTFRADLRRSVIFGEHNLVSDAPISRLDLLVCRNTLMYFNADVQTHVLNRFHYALRPHGVLFLGRAEKLLSHDRPFAPHDASRRFFHRSPGHARQRLLEPDESRDRAIEHAMANLDLRERLVDVGPVAKVAIDPDGYLVSANDRARELFRLRHRDLGRALRDLDLSHRPTELRGAIEEVTATGETVEMTGLRWTAGPDDERVLDVTVVPVADDDRHLGTAITFLDVTARAELQRELEVAAQQVDIAYEQLQASNQELETTNEELQSTIEELETTNEELQSSNEELHATNDELHATNEELQRRTTELDDVNAFLQEVLTGLDRGVVVVDPDLLVRVWNDRAQELWGLREDEVLGRNFLNLDIGLPVDDLRDAVRGQLRGHASGVEVELPARDRDGRAVRCRVTCSPLRSVDGSVRGAIMLIEADPGAASP